MTWRARVFLSCLAHALSIGCQREGFDRESVRPEVQVEGHGLLEGAQHLRRTFALLRAIEAGQPTRVGIAQIGASHTAAQFFSDEMIERLTARFGGLGPGYVPFAPMRPHFAAEASASERSRVRVSREGRWQLGHALASYNRDLFGLAGSRAVAEAPARVTVDLQTEDVRRGWLDVFYVDTGPATRIELYAPGASQLLSMSLAGLKPRTRTATIALDPGPKSFELVVSAGRAILLGFAYEREGSGLVYDVLGLSGSSVQLVQSRYEPQSFGAQLRARQPALYLLFFGTNESVTESLSIADFRARYRSLIETLRQASPNAECLLVSNTDREVEVDGEWVAAPHADDVEEAISDVAVGSRCAFWSAREAMGGEGGMEEWLSLAPPLALPDRTHLTELGYRTLAGMLVEDLMQTYAAP